MANENNNDDDGNETEGIYKIELSMPVYTWKS